MGGNPQQDEDCAEKARAYAEAERHANGLAAAMRKLRELEEGKQKQKRDK